MYPFIETKMYKADLKRTSRLYHLKIPWNSKKTKTTIMKLTLLFTTTVVILIAVSHATSLVKGTAYDFKTLGGVENVLTHEAAVANAGLFNKILNGTLKNGDTLVFPNTTFYMMGGITASGLEGVTIQFDGTIIFADDKKSINNWPRHHPPALAEGKRQHHKKEKHNKKRKKIGCKNA